MLAVNEIDTVVLRKEWDGSVWDHTSVLCAHDDKSKFQGTGPPFSGKGNGC